MKGTNYYRQLLDGERLAFTLLAYLGGDPSGGGDYDSFINLLKDKWGMSAGTAFRSVQLLCEMELFVLESKQIKFAPAVVDLFQSENGYYVAIDRVNDVYGRQLGRLCHYVNPTVIFVQLGFCPRSEEDLVKDLVDRYPDYAPQRVSDEIRSCLADGSIVAKEGLLYLSPVEEKKANGG